MIQENVSLQPYNTFGVEAKTRFFAVAKTVTELKEILGWYRNQSDCPLLVVGGGSNMLFTKDWDGLALKIEIKGLNIIEEKEALTLVSAGAGEDWHEFVVWTLEQGLNGLENLSLIPGLVGASPMQNIGAYGVEIKDVFWSLEAINIKTGQIKTFSQEACAFGYRESVFKKAEKGNWIIISVVFALKGDGVVTVDYGTIKTVLEAHEIVQPTPLQVSQAVTAIRQAKLPDPKVLGSAGSFFKNPTISATALVDLQVLLPEVPHFKQAENNFKIPAGYLIEKAGWKGFRKGDCGVHQQQALVLVNYGQASGLELLTLSKQIQGSVYQKFNVRLVPEVNVI